MSYLDGGNDRDDDDLDYNYDNPRDNHASASDDDLDYDYDYDRNDSRPLYGRGRRILMRVIVLVCVGALVVPGIASAMSHYYVIAHTTCARAALYSDAATQSTRATFEVFGPGVIGWECYATSASGERHVVSLGMFPVDVVPDGPVNRA